MPINFKSSKKQGFTLIELLVVISIIAVLSSIALLTFSSLQKKSRDTQRLSDLKVIQGAIEQYHADYTRYPCSLNTTNCNAEAIPINQPITNQVGVPTPIPIPATLKTYLYKSPKEPKVGKTGFENYYYSSISSNTNYCLYTHLEDISGIMQPVPTICSPAPTNYNYAVTGP